MPPPPNQLGNSMVLPPPPPPLRYPANTGNTLAPNNLPPPPSGPPPGSALGQQAPWSNAWGNRMGYSVPPPPPLIPGGGMINPNAPVPAQRPYNPQAHANMNNSGPNAMPPPPPMQVPGTGMEMSATYIPGIDTFGEGVGIPGLGGIITEESTPYSAHSSAKTPWSGISPNTNDFNANSAASHNHNHNHNLSPPSAGASSQVGTPSDEYASRQTNNNSLAPHSNNLGGHGMSISSNASSSRGVPPEMASQWPIDRVLSWLQANQFPKDWYDAFQTLELCGTHFLELGSAHGGRGNFSLMHQQVYPTLKQLWMARTGRPGELWEPTKDREEGRRMRHLIRSIVSGRPVDPSKFTSPSSATLNNLHSGASGASSGGTPAPSSASGPSHTSHAAHARQESNPMSAPSQNLSAQSLPSAGAEPDSPNVSGPTVDLPPMSSIGPARTGDDEDMKIRRPYGVVNTPANHRSLQYADPHQSPRPRLFVTPHLAKQYSIEPPPLARYQRCNIHPRSQLCRRQSPQRLQEYRRRQCKKPP